ncbi:hypothetical protein [Oceanobacillus sp. J11TS1]|uniref:hypothetical protein n=1 Tax=Oceanobacillus sp. J11TS1 TaxID=2807191 RepID=UPI001B13DF2D|nr:hypothetical protein [Oceanobacillus sp. J11TS1]GIO22464.1 hypothetical protein J11TS1_10450 [Oceanobacillus sp. J11TS1]
MPLSDNYKATDLALVMQEYERLFSATEKVFQMADTAQFELQGNAILEINGALENLSILNRKKKDADAVKPINEDIRRHMF